MAGQEDNGFLGRWSRRKAAAKTTETIEDIQTAKEIEAPQDGTLPAGSETDEVETFDVKSLPDIESLGPSSDFSVFMQAGVPPALKTQALRKLWRVKSNLANLDGLIDYGEDLTGSFKVTQHLQTAYEVGRGFLKDKPEDDSQQEHAAEDGGVETENASQEITQVSENGAANSDRTELNVSEDKSENGGKTRRKTEKRDG